MSKCPKCGKTLSVTIRHCPKCGCDTKIFLEEKMRKLDSDPNLKFQYRFVPPPANPKRKTPVIAKIAIVILTLILALGVFVEIIVCEDLGRFFVSLWKCSYIWGSCLVVIILSLLYSKREYEQELEECELYKQNPEEYKLRKAIETVRYFTYESTSPKTTPTITCPYCKSTNVKKITTTSRVIGAATMGLASSNIGNQWYCNNCKSKF